jgi:ATP adenylyltransferase
VTQSWDRIYTPHRLEYLRGANTSDECAFCVAPELDGRDTLDLVAHRGHLAYVVLNLYPYNAGHLLICPYRHVADYTELTDAERDEIALLTQESMQTLRAISGAHVRPVAHAGRDMILFSTSAAETARVRRG